MICCHQVTNLFCSRCCFTSSLPARSPCNLDMEPKPESLWWTSTCKDEDMTTLKLGNRGGKLDLPFKEVFDVRATVSVAIGRGFKAQRGRCAKAWAAGGGTSSSIVRREYPRHVYSTALVDWPQSGAMLNNGRGKPASYVSPFGPACYLAKTVEDNGSPAVDRENCGHNLEDYELGYL